MEKKRGKLIDVLCRSACTFFILLPLWDKKFMESSNDLLRIIYKDNNPDLYIAENKRLLQGNKSPSKKAVLHINICAGYCEKGDYEAAKYQLSAIGKLGLFHGFHRAVYLANCAYVGFYLGETTEALSYMKQNRRGLRQLQSHPDYGGLVAILHIFELLAADNPEEACKFYKASPNWYKSGRTRNDFEFLKQMLGDVG